MKDWKQNLYLIYEYQQTLLGKSSNIPACYFANIGSPPVREADDKGDNTPTAKDKPAKKSNDTLFKNEKAAIAVLRYAVEELLHWSPEQMRDRFNQEVIDRLKLNRVINMIAFPPETDKKIDYFVYAYKLYPKIIRLDRRKLTIIVFNRVMNRELSKFPKGFFDDSLGRYRAVICLNYALTLEHSFGNVSEMYAKFAGAEGKRIIKYYHLDLARRLSWDSPIDYLHESLSSTDKNEVWYHFYKLFPAS